MKIPVYFIEALDKEYNKAGLIKFYASFLKQFLEDNRSFCRLHEVDLSILEKKTPTKADLLPAFARCMYDGAVFEKMKQALPQPLPQVMEWLLWEGPRLHQEVERKFGVEIVSASGSYDKESYIDGLYLCLGIKQTEEHYSFGKTSYTFTFHIPEIVKNRIRPFFPLPDIYLLKPVETPEKTAFVYEGSSTIIEEFPLLLTYYQQGDLKLTTSGKPQASSVNRMRKYCNTREFFPDDKENKDLSSLRTLLVAEALALTTDIDWQTASVPDMLKILTEYVNKGKFSILYSLLFHLKGTGYVKSNYENRQVNRELVNIMRQIPDNKWFNIENLLRHIRVEFPELQIVTEHTAQSYLYFEEEVQSPYGSYTYTDKLYIRPGAYDNAITRPMVKSFFFFFAALGLADIAYDYPADENAKRIKRDYFSVFDGLQYVRINDLGAYVLGKKNEYTLAKQPVSAQVHLEEDHLIIHFSGEDKVVAVVIDKFAVKTGENRYKADYGIFLKDCQNRKDIENKINLFRSRIAENPPPLWEDFFSELLGKYDPLKKQPHYLVYKIPPADKELIMLIARDEVLKNMVIKAENYHILFPETQLTAFRARLEKFGYLMKRGRETD